LIGLGDLGVLVVGGETARPRTGKSLADAWIFKMGQWTPANNSIPPFLADAAGYDARLGRAIVLSEEYSNREVVSPSATFIYDPRIDRWDQKAVTGRPSVAAARAAYDSKAHRLIVVTDRGETWSYDLETDRWTNRCPRVTPPGRDYAALAYDEGSDRTILFGGDVFGDDTWAYDYAANTWTEMRPAKSPASRLYHAMVYDPKTDRMILFGGALNGSERPLADTWTYDFDSNTWQELTPERAPTARGWHAMAYDATSGTIVLFGGGADRDHFQADTWIFDPVRRTWTSGP
jgi:hypothetical protein